jgi:hypothetical protein
LDGTLHEELGIGTERGVPPAVSDGGPNAPVKPEPLRVSITRQGVSAINVIGPGALKMLSARGSADASCRAAMMLDFSWLRRPIQRGSPIPERWRQRLLGIE